MRAVKQPGTTKTEEDDTITGTLYNKQRVEQLAERRNP